MSPRFIWIFAAISGFILVAFGAFGAHVLSPMLSEKQMQWIGTGLEYQTTHTLAIFVLAVAIQRQANIWFSRSALAMMLGIVLFSGSLYVLALSNTKIAVYFTPVGGACFLVGWLLILIGALRLNKA